ncbi:hypothetical protein HYDPIDRAFT_34235 [Hydnomerulius pinastri MD-312]|uniref:Uncharacterized protein n=1 Tax=Hydnomerulius pinastri MD-312 TaxID=994086 RepID=A0A0C9VLA6_9AGAM|nr:hypothetical protein HYDPIDRAFT_34235 [Hydnomerulius pinastri MD-312]
MWALLSSVQDLYGSEHDIVISQAMLSRTLNQAGLTRKILQKLAAEWDDVRHEELKARLLNNLIGDGSEFVVIAEMSKNEKTCTALWMGIKGTTHTTYQCLYLW